MIATNVAMAPVTFAQDLKVIWLLLFILDPDCSRISLEIS
jgi:hypothetical protein